MDAKGKAPMAEEDIAAEEEEGDAQEDADEDEDAEGSEEDDSDDMKLAWEMLEVARTICPPDQPLQLAGDGVYCPFILQFFPPCAFVWGRTAAVLTCHCAASKTFTWLEKRRSVANNARDLHVAKFK